MNRGRLKKEPKKGTGRHREREREREQTRRHIVKAVTSATAAAQTIIGLMSCDRFN